jgi:hypothetical protein
MVVDKPSSDVEHLECSKQEGVPPAAGTVLMKRQRESYGLSGM